MKFWKNAGNAGSPVHTQNYSNMWFFPRWAHATRKLHSLWPLLIQNFLSKYNSILLAHPSNFIKSMKTFTGQSVRQSYVLSLIIFLYVRNILYVIDW